MAAIKIFSVISKLRPRIERGRVIELDTLADEIAELSGFDRGDAQDFAYKFSQSLIRHLQVGEYVKLGDIGSFYVSCNKDKKIKVNYRTSSEIDHNVVLGFRGNFTNSNNSGLNDEGYATRWLELHPEDTVIMRDGSTRTV